MIDHFTFVRKENGGRWRVYKCDEKLALSTRKWRDDEGYDKIMRSKLADADNKKCIKNSMEPVDAPTDIFVVSDAWDHEERLVFPAYTKVDIPESECQNCKNWPDDYLYVEMLHVAGKMTMLIFGGDAETIRPDEEYLKELWNVNHEAGKE